MATFPLCHIGFGNDQIPQSGVLSGFVFQHCSLGDITLNERGQTKSVPRLKVGTYHYNWSTIGLHVLVQQILFRIPSHLMLSLLKKILPSLRGQD
jgi:hypothetical protein